MTKERRLAIEMWKGIRDMLSASDRVVLYQSIIEYKHRFCKQHNLHWLHDCWFCQYTMGTLKTDHRYFHKCSRCPLKVCNSTPDSFYGIVLADHKEKDARVSACNSIIKVLGGEV